MLNFVSLSNLGASRAVVVFLLSQHVSLLLDTTPNRISDRKVIRASRLALVALMSSLFSISLPQYFRYKFIVIFFIF